MCKDIWTKTQVLGLQSNLFFMNTSKLSQKSQSQKTKNHESTSMNAQVGSSAILISVCVMISRITGFFRTWAMAFALGSTMLSSSYQVANNLPNMLYELVAGGMIVTAFLPVYVSVKKRLGKIGGNAYASNLLGLAAIFLGIIAILCTLFAPQLIYTQSMMSDQSEMNNAILFFRFFAFQIVFYGLSAIVSGVLNAERDYFWSSIAPAFNNIIVIATFVAYALIAPSNPDLAIYIIAIGNPLGVVAQMAIQLPALKKHGIKIHWRVNIHDPALRETLQIGVPAIFVMAISFCIVSAQTTVAYKIADNGPSIIAYARLWFTFPYSFLAVPITTAMFTELSEMLTEHDTDKFKNGVMEGTRQILFLTIPFALYLIVFSYPLATLYHAGAFTSDDIHSVGLYLAFLAISLPFYSVNTYLQKIFSSLRKMNRFAVISITCAGVQIFFTVIMGAIIMIHTPFALEMVALGETVFYILFDLICFIYLHKKFGSMGLSSIAKTFITSGFVGILGALAGFVVGPLFIGSLLSGVLAQGSIISALAQIILGGICALAVTFGIAIKLHLPGVNAIQHAFGKIRKRFHRA